MPAASEGPGSGPGTAELPPLPRTWRPMGSRYMAIGLAVALLVIGAATWMGFDAETRALWTLFQKSTVIAFYLAAVVLGYCLARCRVDAREDGLTVVNGFSRHDYAWAQVVSVSMGRGEPWAKIDLSDGETIPAVAIQASDGERAQAAVRDLRAYLAQRAGQGD